jgi:hypothetical protein
VRPFEGNEAEKLGKTTVFPPFYALDSQFAAFPSSPIINYAIFVS